MDAGDRTDTGGAGGIDMSWTYYIPFGIGTVFQDYDRYKEQKRWNADFTRNTGRTVKYPMRSGTSEDVALARVWNSTMDAVRTVSSVMRM